MEHNNTYNLMHQLTQESKSLWRIKNNYLNESLTDEEKAFWNKLAQDKEVYITELKELIKSALQ
jgi:uncharacterized FlgJ-related protein